MGFNFARGSIDLYGAYGYIYIILDPNKKTKDMEKLISRRATLPKEIDEKIDKFIVEKINGGAFGEKLIEG